MSSSQRKRESARLFGNADLPRLQLEILRYLTPIDVLRCVEKTSTFLREVSGYRGLWMGYFIWYFGKSVAVNYLSAKQPLTRKSFLDLVRVGLDVIEGKKIDFRGLWKNESFTYHCRVTLFPGQRGERCWRTLPIGERPIDEHGYGTLSDSQLRAFKQKAYEACEASLKEEKKDSKHAPVRVAGRIQWYLTDGPDAYLARCGDERTAFEYVVGCYDVSSGALHFQGTHINEKAHGVIGQDRYRLKVRSRRGLEMSGKTLNYGEWKATMECHNAALPKPAAEDDVTCAPGAFDAYWKEAIDAFDAETPSERAEKSGA
eukprot:g1729.t1